MADDTPLCSPPESSRNLFNLEGAVGVRPEVMTGGGVDCFMTPYPFPLEKIYVTIFCTSVKCFPFSTRKVFVNERKPLWHVIVAYVGSFESVRKHWS